jgi:pimeloyl-ACP methyl ester carboxylesterase
VQALRAAGFEVEAPDFQGMNLAARVDKLTRLLKNRASRPLLVGSSYGGITALCAAVILAQEGHDCGPLLLCAPALGIAESPATDLELSPPGLVRILHGTKDDVVPIEVSRRIAQAHPDKVSLLELDDDHRLSKSLALIVEEARKLKG